MSEWAIVASLVVATLAGGTAGYVVGSLVGLNTTIRILRAARADLPPGELRDQLGAIIRRLVQR